MIKQNHTTTLYDLANSVGGSGSAPAGFCLAELVFGEALGSVSRAVSLLEEGTPGLLVFHWVGTGPGGS